MFRKWIGFGVFVVLVGFAAGFLSLGQSERVYAADECPAGQTVGNPSKGQDSGYCYEQSCKNFKPNGACASADVTYDKKGKVKNTTPSNPQAGTPSGTGPESYSWQNFKSIGAKGGEYNRINNGAEGDAQAITFVMSENDPNIFVSKLNSDDCKGELKLKLPADKAQKASLEIPQSCPALAKLTKDVTIGRADTIVSTTIAHDRRMKEQFLTENCEAFKGDPKLAQCNTAAQNSYTQKSQDCKSKFDYDKATQLADKYLDCLSEALCVERPSDTVEKVEPKDEKTKCALPYVGWALCQILQLQAWVTDFSFDLFTGLLTVDPLSDKIKQSPPTNPNPTSPTQPTAPTNTATNNQLPNPNGTYTSTYIAWRFFLGFTNLIFVAVFLLIIYSYITGWGLSVYNLKVMTPRFIVTILLVNMSFTICAITIDVSNILGRTIRDTLQDITPPQVAGSEYTSWTQITNKVIATEPTDQEKAAENKTSGTSTQPGQQSQDSSLSPRCQAAKATNEENKQKEKEQEEQGENQPRTYEPDAMSEIKMGGMSLVGAVVMFAMLVVLIPSMTVVLCALMLVLILMLIRQAAIIILVVISPLAFALNVLPGTKSWFARWWKSFFTIVMLYPMLSLIFGAAYIASHVIQDRGLEYDDIFIVMFSFTIQMLPFFFLPALMKLGSGVITKASNLMNSDRSPFSKVKALDADRIEGRRIRKMGEAANGPAPKNYQLLTRMRRRRAKIEANRNTTKSLLGDAEKRHKAQATIRMGEDSQSEAAEEAAALAAQDLNTIDMNTIRAQSARIDSEGQQGMARQALLDNARSSGNMDDLAQAAHMLSSLNHATTADIYELIASSGKMSDSARRVLVDHLRKTGFSKANAQFGGAALQNIEEGGFNSRQDIDNLMVGAVNSGKFSAEVLANQSDHALNEIHRLQGQLDEGGSRMLNERSRMIMNDPKLRDRMTSSGLSRVSDFRRVR